MNFVFCSYIYAVEIKLRLVILSVQNRLKLKLTFVSNALPSLLLSSQKKAWPDHKRECKCLKSCKPRYPPDSVRLLGRAVVRLVSTNSLEKPGFN